MITLMLPDPAATDMLGRRLARVLRAGDVVLLEGPLGAGKSALARAVLRALTGDPALEVPSPTYTLVQTYDTPLGMVAHFDLWRLEGEEGVQELGWDESALALVEWPDRLGSLRLRDALVVALSPEGEGRRVVLTGWEGRL
jgi:tRNA threonylcarbamoyladenosine biosynthesis protein TsaE